MTNNNIVRSDFFLTPEEYYRKRANIIEELKKCSIDISYNDGLNSIQEKNSTKKARKYLINIQTPVDPSIPKKTAVYHELSHALWDSFVSGSLDILRQWSHETMARLLAENKIPNCSSNASAIPRHLTTEIVQAQEKIQIYINTIYSMHSVCFFS